MLGAGALDGRTFLDAGSGSGLFSLAALRLGAARVVSFDYDEQSVACALELRRRYAADDPRWTIERGSVLDPEYLEQLGTFDVVYSWGVLHHTGHMWRALELIVRAVAPEGTLFIAIYNDNGLASRFWRVVKRRYNHLPVALRTPYVIAFGAPLQLRYAAIMLLRGRVRDYVRSMRRTTQVRGMSPWHDLVDWIGGYPFEVARPDEIFDFGRAHELVLERLITRVTGCNEFVFAGRRARS